MSKEHSEKKKQINIAAAAIAAVLVICLCTVFAMGKKAPGKTETEAVSGAGTAEAETTQEPVDWDSLDKVTLNHTNMGCYIKYHLADPGNRCQWRRKKEPERHIREPWLIF